REGARRPLGGPAEAALPPAQPGGRPPGGAAGRGGRRGRAEAVFTAAGLSQGAGKPRRRRHSGRGAAPPAVEDLPMRKILFIIVILALAGGGLGFWYARKGDNGGGNFRTEPVHRGDLVATISATGTVEPEDIADVGAQVAGQIMKFGEGK